MNPLEAIETKIEAKFTSAKAELLRQIHIDLLRETAMSVLSRLATLDTERAADYLAAVKVIS